MAGEKVTRNIQNLGDLSLAVLENDIEYLLFVDNEELFPMTEYTKLLPVVEGLAKLIMVHADSVARKVHDETVSNIANHLTQEVGNVVHRSKIPTVETLVVTESKVAVPVEDDKAHYDW